MENSQLTGMVRSLQIIGAALIMGVVGFAIVTFLIVNWEQINAELTPLGIIALVVPLLSSAAAFIVPGILLKQAATQYANANPKPELHSLLRASGQAAAAQSIAGLALAEGGSLMALVVWMTSGNILGLVGAFFCLATSILKFPTQGKIEQQLANFRDELKLQQRGR